MVSAAFEKSTNPPIHTLHMYIREVDPAPLLVLLL